LLGQIAVVRDNVDLIFLLIVAVSVLPIAWEVVKRYRSGRGKSPAGDDEPADRPAA
ncbi:MAG: DedA family protein, partial [Nocardia sp.]|nr:DedA family protein [Nocardia sp.]